MSDILHEMDVFSYGFVHCFLPSIVFVALGCLAYRLLSHFREHDEVGFLGYLLAATIVWLLLCISPIAQLIREWSNAFPSLDDMQAQQPMPSPTGRMLWNAVGSAVGLVVAWAFDRKYLT